MNRIQWAIYLNYVSKEVKTWMKSWPNAIFPSLFFGYTLLYTTTSIPIIHSIKNHLVTESPKKDATIYFAYNSVNFYYPGHNQIRMGTIVDLIPLKLKYPNNFACYGHFLQIGLWDWADFFCIGSGVFRHKYVRHHRRLHIKICPQHFMQC